MQIFSRNKFVFLLLAAASGLTACGGGTSTTSVNGNQANISNVPLVGNVNVVTNTNVNSANSNVLTGEGVGIEAREPDQYQATVTLKLETGGTEKSAALPPLAAQVARMGNNKRMEFAAPGGEKLIYLDRGGQQLLISPQRKQYAELNKEALGFEIRQLLTPEQIVKQVKNLKGVQRAGEEKLGDRDVIRYRYNATTQVSPQQSANANAPAANVSTDAVVLVDKETGLPLRSETYAESQNANVSGMNRLRLITEMSNVQMTADPALFNEPTDFRKVPPEEIRAQVDSIFRILGAFLQQAMSSQQRSNNQAPPTVNSPAPATP